VTRLHDLLAVTFDFGNTLVPVTRAALERVVEATADEVAARLGPFDRTEFLVVWREERERQFREEVPQFREVDLAERFVRVLARLRGMPAPSPEGRWDQARAAGRSAPTEVEWAVEAYSRAFVVGLPAPPEVGPLLARLATRYRLGIVSNWPLAATIDRFVEAAGWSRHLAAVVVSQRVGAIKPHPAIFRAAEQALGLREAEGRRVLHVGDDWAADVVGGKQAGWRVAYLRARPGDSPLPSSERDATVVPDLELDTLAGLEDVLA
jgi:putative hydrolase of the HAD superfamily